MLPASQVYGNETVNVSERHHASTDQANRRCCHTLVVTATHRWRHGHTRWPQRNRQLLPITITDTSADAAASSTPSMAKPPLPSMPATSPPSPGLPQTSIPPTPPTTTAPSQARATRTSPSPTPLSTSPASTPSMATPRSHRCQQHHHPHRCCRNIDQNTAYTANDNGSISGLKQRERHPLRHLTHRLHPQHP